MLCAPATGCLGVSANPSYFPYLLPTWDVIPTHAKPIWPGAAANFDPAANTIVLMPLEATSRVRTQLPLENDRTTVRHDKAGPDQQHA